MRERCLRAVQRGGCLSRVDEHSWAVWRSHDRRARSIGQLSGVEVDGLLALGHLKPLGEDLSSPLVWTGPPPSPAELRSDRPPGPDAVFRLQEASARHRALLVRLLEGYHDAGQRERLRNAALRFAMDVEAAQAVGAPTTMNWHAMQMGGQSRSFRCRGGGHGSSLYARQAQARLDNIAGSLGKDAMVWLRALIIDQKTRNAVQVSFGLAAAQAEQRAAQYLESLADKLDELAR